MEYDFHCNNCNRFWVQQSPTKQFCNRCGSANIGNLTLQQRPTKYAPDSLKAVAKSLPKSRKNKKVLPAVSG